MNHTCTDSRRHTFLFPPSFIFGAATSALQVEGCIDPARFGRGKSIWETYFSKHPELDDATVATNHYELMRKDVRLMKVLGLQSYRFSVSWPRVLPSGHGAINEQGLDFYDRLVDQLLTADIIPNLTLYHWDLPQALEEGGGWCSRDTASYFADYATVIAQRLGDRVPLWATLNEPEVIVAGYIGKDLAPGRNDRRLRTTVIHNLLLAHGYALQALRSIIPERQIGIVLNLVPVDPLTDAAEAAAKERWMRDYAVYLEAVLRGEYPELVFVEAARCGAAINTADMSTIAGQLDFLGINWYLRFVVDEHNRLVEVPDVPRTAMGWEIRPEALTRMLTNLAASYSLPPIYITENGAALKDELVDGCIEDVDRVEYLAEHLHALEDAINRGVDVRGYYVWSLLDNLEWSFGYAKTFGIVHVDRASLKRTPKRSAYWYREVIERHSGQGAK